MKKLIALLLAVFMVMTMFAGCAQDGGTTTTAGGNDTPDTTAGNDTPDTTAGGDTAEVKEFTLAVAATDVAPINEERWIWEKYEEMTGIHINWVEIPSSAVSERKNMMMLSDTEKPDAFWAMSWGTSDLIKYGSTGAFVNLNDYPDAWPNLKKRLTDDINGGMAAVTMPDGGIYGMPNIYLTSNNPWGPSCRLWIPQAWLDALNMEVPTSIDELTAFYEGVKTQDVNGNGDPNDEVPIYLPNGSVDWAFEILLLGAYGLYDTGKKPLDERYIIREGDVVEYLWTSPEVKALWQQEAEWWAAGYYYPDTFGTYEYSQWTTDGTNGKVGSFVWVGADYVYAGAEYDYTYILNLSSDMSEGGLSWIDYDVRGLSMFSITDACEDPAALISWCDYFYSEEGTIFNHYGVEGETYTIDDAGHIRYIDEIVNYESGGQLGAFQYGLLVYSNYAHIGPHEATFKYAIGADDLGDIYAGYGDDIVPYLPTHAVPGMLATESEGNDLAALDTDLYTAVTEARVKFITGEWNFESDWDAYVEQLESMGLDQFVEIRQTQYNRYLENVG